MNWDRIQGSWKQVTGQAKEQWGKLTDDDLDVVGGRRDQLAGKIQERYGVAKEDAEKQIGEWERKATDSWFDKKYSSSARASNARLVMSVAQQPLRDVIPVRLAQRRDRKPVATLEQQHLGQLGCGAQLGQAYQPRLAQGLHIEQQPARLIGSGLGVKVG